MGELNVFAKLTNTEVKQILDLHATGNYSYGSIARTFGVSRITISNIVRGLTWKHIPRGT